MEAHSIGPFGFVSGLAVLGLPPDKIVMTPHVALRKQKATWGFFLFALPFLDVLDMFRAMRLREMIESGCDLRLWCFRCGRGATLAIIPEDLDAMIARASCKECRRRDQVLLLPARSDFVNLSGAEANSRLVEAFFHGNRRKGRR